jgi:hypothetical protein
MDRPGRRDLFTFTFTPRGNDRYAISLQANGCHITDDGEVTGSNEHFSGSVNLYLYNETASSCATRIGVAPITVGIVPGGNIARVVITRAAAGATSCENCGVQTWTKQKT